MLDRKGGNDWAFYIAWCFLFTFGIELGRQRRRASNRAKRSCNVSHIMTRACLVHPQRQYINQPFISSQEIYGANTLAMHFLYRKLSRRSSFKDEYYNYMYFLHAHGCDIPAENRTADKRQQRYYVSTCHTKSHTLVTHASKTQHCIAMRRLQDKLPYTSSMKRQRNHTCSSLLACL